VLVDYLLAGQVRYEFRMFPTAGGSMSIFAGQVAECADDLTEGGFWQSYEVLYDIALEGSYNVDDIMQITAHELDLDRDELLDCMRDAQQVETDTTLGIELGIPGTPAIMVRYGEGEPVFIEFDGVTYDRGGVPEDVLRAVIEEAQEEIEPTPTGSK
jgi:protein-disulfide isomerase